MALITYGGGVTGISGSMGGTVYSHNSFGAYIRARTIPVNPRSSRQSVVRAAIAFLANHWAQDLSAAQRAAWGLYGSSVAMTNRIGASIFLTGYQQFLRSNSILKRAPGRVVNPGPTVFELPAQDPTLALTADESLQTISISFDDAMTWASQDSAYCHVFQGKPQNGQRNFFNGPHRLLATFAGDSGSPVSSPQSANVQFAIAAGQRQWIYARIQLADGRLSEPFRADSIVID